MDLHVLSLGTLVLQGPCGLFYATLLIYHFYFNLILLILISHTCRANIYLIDAQY